MKKIGIVFSTSRGKLNAKGFFYSFLSNVVYAQTEVHQVFVNNSDINRMSVRFHFTFEMKDGEKESGEYVDEFIFSPCSSKLSAVYMFENLHFEN